TNPTNYTNPVGTNTTGVSTAATMSDEYLLADASNSMPQRVIQHKVHITNVVSLVRSGSNAMETAAVSYSEPAIDVSTGGNPNPSGSHVGEVVNTYETGFLSEVEIARFVIITNKREIPPGDLSITNETYDGVIYKVQFAALRDPSTQYMFKGISPVSTEPSGTGFTRYMAGIFRNSAEATAAKRIITGYGFPGAFVVAYYNGTRVPVSSADSKVAAGESSKKLNKSKVEINEYVVKALNGAPSASSYAAAPGFTNLSPASDITSKPGSFYSVQVGAYSKPVESGPVKQIPNLLHEKLASGLVRYLSGVYQTMDQANAAKATFVGMGVSDAFVVRYENGKRVQAVVNGTPVNTSSYNSGGVSPVTSQPEVTHTSSYTPPVEIVRPVETNETTTEPETVSPSNSSAPPSGNIVSVTSANDITAMPGVVYSIQIGFFSRPVAKEELYNVKDIYHHTLDNGYTRYFAGKYIYIDDAYAAREDLMLKGISDAFVVAYYNGKRVSLEEAEELQND
ncbi:MAG: hypothetical protein KKA07_07825, partial [Bacteroidetes bacterium]|nr:hypothetical protein [Bacteroidota bacterium]MBU1718971.1 hypothetical protein [Bacteroidota bacterium]